MITDTTKNGTRPRETNGHSRMPAERRLSKGEPAKKLLGFLPIARLIPQDIHSVLDYVNGLTVASGALLDDNTAAFTASLSLGAAVIGVSLMTDYRLSAVKLIPIRTHEAADYLWGGSCIAAPFLLGYWKKAPRVAMTHVMTGAMTILASLFTDYRSYQRARS